MHLSPRQVETYRRDGVLPLGKILTETHVQEACARLETLIAQDKLDKPESAPGQYIYRRLNVSQFDPWFGTLVRSDAVLNVAESVLGPDVQYYQDNIFYKPAAVGGATPFHQDNIWWHGHPPDMLTLWIALDPVDAGNGPVRYAAGSHSQMIDHTLPVNDPGGFTYNVIDPARVDKSKLVSWCLAPGEAVMHHCQTIHGSPPNSSPRPRRGYTIHLMRAGLFADNGNPVLRGRMPSTAAPTAVTSQT